MIDDLSDDTILFHTIKLKYQYCFAILIIMKYKSLEYNAADLIDAIGEENGLNLNISIGFSCNDIRELPASLYGCTHRKETLLPKLGSQICRIERFAI